MKSSYMRDLLLEKFDYLFVWNGECSIEDFLGKGQLLGGEETLNKYHSYVCVYSSERDHPFIDERPDAIYLPDDNVCVFLYELED